LTPYQQIHGNASPPQRVLAKTPSAKIATPSTSSNNRLPGSICHQDTKIGNRYFGDRVFTSGLVHGECGVEQAYATLRVMGIVNNEGEGRRLLADYRQLRQAQAMWARELGLTPAARMSIKAGRAGAALDLVAQMARAEEPPAEDPPDEQQPPVEDPLVKESPEEPGKPAPMKSAEGSEPIDLVHRHYIDQPAP
jgi:hypothetical protein